MTRANALQRIILLAILASSSTSFAISSRQQLNLSEAEHIAIASAPELKQLQANADSLREQAVADGQWADPQLIAGAANVPTNSYSFTQDDMTMVQVGLQQTFAPGHSLAMKSKKTSALAKAEQQKIQEQAAMLLRNVRETWLDLYYWNQAATILRENRSLYKQLLKTNESEYSAGRSSQSDVLQLRLELSRLNDQSVQAEQRIDVLQAQLGRWIGADEANRPLVNSLPHWSNPPPFDILQSRLMQHPMLKVDTANIEAAYDEVAFAKEQYKPGWTVDVGYGIRQGTYMDGSGKTRSNFVGAQVTVDLPFFTGNRQDKRLSASAHQLEATMFDRDVHYKDLLKELTAQYAIWQSLSKRESVYRQHLRPEATQNSKAALLAYKNSTTDFSTVLRAYSNNLTVRLEQIQIEVEHAKARAALLYLEGVTQ
ncbi:MAG: TolC family protein [Gammaproteobacteria bacterium]|nr:TolC family protein [Gammaproteobacteria bacterium]